MELLGRFHCWRKANMKANSDDSMENQSQDFESRVIRKISLLENRVFPKRGTVKLPDLKAKLRKVSGVRPCCGA